MLKSTWLVLSLLISACNISQNKLNEKGDCKKHSLRVDDIQIMDNYNPPFSKPHMEHLMRHSPSFMIKRWVDRHLIPMGDGNILRVAIDNARLIQKFNAGQHEYEINIDLTLSLIENGALPNSKIAKNILINKITYSKTAKNLKVDREFFDKMTKELIEELAIKIEQALDAEFHNLLIS
jgi:hypothetical protein